MRPVLVPGAGARKYQAFPAQANIRMPARRRDRPTSVPFTPGTTMRIGTLTLRALAGVALLAAHALHAQGGYDLIIRNGRVLDGSGNPWYRADVAIRGDRIVAVGDLSGQRAAREIDASGLYVAPGFIDVHTHAGEGLATAALSHGQPLLAQGITTVLVNPDGGGATDMARQRAEMQSHGIGVNVAQMVPHGSVRSRVMGMADRAPTPAEMDQMRALVRAGMEEGAFGLSTGPWYAPGSFAKTEELIDLSRIVAG